MSESSNMAEAAKTAKTALITAPVQVLVWLPALNLRAMVTASTPVA